MGNVRKSNANTIKQNMSVQDLLELSAGPFPKRIKSSFPSSSYINIK